MGHRSTLLFPMLLAAASTALATDPAHAQCGGICLYELGSFDMATSAAGAGARADSPATALFNPAGMTRLDDTQVHIGMINAIGSLKFNTSSRTEPNPPAPGPPFALFGGGGNIGTYLPLAGAYASHAVTEDFSIGLAFGGLWGGSADYDNDWAGRTLVTDASLLAFTIQPALAYRLTDWLSIGGGIGAVYTEFDLEFRSALDFNAPVVQIKDADDWGVVGSIGLLFEPSENTRVGLYWRSEVSLTLKGDVDLPTSVPVASFRFEGEMNFPQGVNLSLFHQLTPKLALLGDAGWTDWSQFGYMPATVGPISVPIDRGWRDTWRVGVGTQYQVLPRLLLAGGFSYDSSPVKASRRLPDIPVGEAYRFSAGAKFLAAANIELALTYTFLYQGDMGIDELDLPPSGQVTLDGAYDPAHLHFVGIQVTFRFGLGKLSGPVPQS